MLREYGIEPQFIEDRGRVKKVHSSYGQLALKQTKLTHDQLKQYEDKLQYLQYKSPGYSVPIYRTKRGAYFVFGQENEAYYLMPWLQLPIKEDRNNQASYFFKQLGELHTHTVKEEKIRDGEIDKLVNDLTNKWQKRKDELEAFVEKCERNTYMSPFELYFCTYYQEMSHAKGFAMRKLETWKDIIKEKTKYRTVFSHGTPTFQHFLYNEDGQGLFINFERSGHTPPINDLLYFFYRSCKTYPVQNDEWFQWFLAYQKHFPLREEEVILFITYLAYPENLYQVTSQYQQNKRKKSELKHIQLLQRGYWQMKNIEFFLTRIIAFEEEKKEKEQQESPSTS